MPTGGVVAAGAAAISQSGNVMNVNQTSQRAVVNWSTFDVAKGNTVNFNQPNGNASTLNRVNSASQSMINGAVNANGQVVFVNPNGIVFGAGAQVNTGGLVATTMDVADSEFMSGSGKMQDKRAYGFGPVAQKMQNDIETKRGEKDKFVNEKKTSVESWRKQLDQVNTKINALADDLRIEYKKNEQKAHGYDGLLKRIQISHEIGGMVPWLILMVFLCIEMGPIFFKMMMTKGVYDFMVENYNHRRNVENGIYREDYIYEGKNGVIHMEKWRYLEVESAKLEKEEKTKKQDEINKTIINKWGESKTQDVTINPQKYFTEGDESAVNNNA